MKLKQAIIVRTDLGMGKGKIAGQVAHAAVQAAESIRRYCPDWYYSWLEDDNLETKIILKVDSEAKLEALSRDAFAQGITHHVVKNSRCTINILLVGISSVPVSL